MRETTEGGAEETDGEKSKRGRRVTATMIFHEDDPLDALFLARYDATEGNGYRRQDFLRRMMIGGLMLQGAVLNSEVLKQLLGRLSAGQDGSNGKPPLDAQG